MQTNKVNYDHPWTVNIVKRKDTPYRVEERTLNDLGREVLFVTSISSFDDVIDYLELNWPTGTKVQWLVKP